VLIWAIIRYRHRPGAAVPPQIHGSTVLEVGWTIAPAVVLFIVAVPTISTIFKTSSEAAMGAGRGPSLQIKAIGHQWWWEFQYPDHQIVTGNEIHIPVGQPIAIALESVDVIHSFWVPRLGGKQDVVPHRTNHIFFTADEPGMYWGQCVEFCGVQHANMKFRLVAHTPDEFQTWVQSQKAAPQPATGTAQEGQQVFMRSACVGCHTIQGTPAQGKVGPDLTHFGSRATVAAGMLDNTRENVARWLRDPQEVKPGNLMPNLRLKEQDVELLVEYLESLK
jgi:cytochrome c oxidase subunit 2